MTLLDGKSTPQKPKRQHNASPKEEKMNSTPSKKTKNGSRKSCSTKIPFDLTLDERQFPTIPNLRLEAKLTAEVVNINWMFFSFVWLNTFLLVKCVQELLHVDVLR